MKSYQIFISYRRDGGDALAGRISDRLKGLGYEVFFDVESMSSGAFNTQILNALAVCKDVLVVLPPNALDRCKNEDDWVRQELAFAIKQKKNIIPIMMRGFSFPECLPADIESVKYMEGVVASSEYFDAVISRIENLLLSKKDTKKNSCVDLKDQCISFISSISLSEYLSVEKYFKSENDIDVSGGVFYICQKILSTPDIDIQSREEFENLLLVLKTIYKLAENKGYNELCSFMRSVSRNNYAEASKNIKEYLLQQYNTLTGEFIDFIWQSLSTCKSNTKIRNYWETLLKEIFILLRMCSSNAPQILNSEVKNNYISFISSISLSEYLAVEIYFKNGNDIDVSGGVFYICQKILSTPNIDIQSREEFEDLLLVLKTIYKLAENKGYNELCSFMRSVSRDNYAEASKNIKEYLLQQYNALTGEFIDFIWQSLSTFENNSKVRNYWERLLKEIFIILKLLS